MRHVAIIGHDPRSAPTPTALEGVEVWGINNAPGWWAEVCPGVPFDRMFQIHERFSLSKAEERCLAEYTGPIYTNWPWEEVIDNRIYPLAGVLAMPGVPGFMSIQLDVIGGTLPYPYPQGGMLTCSFCYALALVCYEQEPTPVDQVTLWGTELQGGSTRERLVEHMGVAWWCGYAAGRGIEVLAGGDSQLLDYPHPYGYRYYAEGDFARRRVLEFEAQARLELREGWWTEYDKGMTERDVEAERGRQAQ